MDGSFDIAANLDVSCSYFRRRFPPERKSVLGPSSSVVRDGSLPWEMLLS